MEVPFNFKERAVGIDFIGREVERNALSNLLRQRQNVVIYGVDGIGKRSLVNSVLINMRKTSLDMLVCDINMHNVRSEEGFLDLYSESLSSVGLDKDSLRSSNVIFYFEEFQNVLHFEDPDKFLKDMERAVAQMPEVTCLFTGSKVNAMKYIFEEKKYFYGDVEILPILPLNEKVASDYITRTFLRVGRVIDKEHVKMFYDISGGMPYYLWLLSSFSFNMTKGFVTPDIRNDAITSVMSLRETYFKSLIDSLSNFQLSLLRAIFDGVTKFSNKEVIEKYGLNSSANVFRLKEALKKKEIVFFDDKDEPHFIDPIFRYWLSKYYFV
jgi:AAA+ ATPase superfamily predicted ATPase